MDEGCSLWTSLRTSLYNRSVVVYTFLQSFFLVKNVRNVDNEKQVGL